MTQSRSLLLCSLAVALIAQAGPGHAQPPAAPAAQTDMNMPDDLGAPLDGPAAAEPAGATLTVETPIQSIASSPQGRAVLEKNLPGMLERPEYMMFRSMSLSKLASMSHGRISRAKLDRIQLQLASVRVASTAPRPHSFFTRGGQAVGRATKAVYVRSGEAVERATRAVYHRVALVIASL